MSNINWIQNIFLSLAKRFGLQLQDKPSYVDDYHLPVSLTAVISSRVTTLTMQDSTISVDGTSARAKYLDDIMRKYQSQKIYAAIETALGTGDCLIKPYTDGERIGLNIIRNGDFVICDSIEDFIKSCIIKTGEIKTDNGTLYERYEVQKLNGTTLEIFNFAYKNGTEIPLESVQAWANIQPYQAIPNMTGVLFARYKCPTLNRGNINGVNGVKITYGLDEVVKDAMDMYRRYIDEFERKESFLFVDKTLLRKSKQEQKDKETYEIPKGKDKVFLKVKGQEDGKNLIYDYSPNIRSNELQNGIDVTFRMLELMAGLSNGILTPPTTSFATATEMKAALTATFAFMTRLRDIVDEGNRELLRCLDVIANYNNLSIMGEWEYTSDWSSGYLEQITEQYNRLLSGHGIGAVEVAEVRAWLMDEDLETARKRVEEIAEQEGKDLLNEAVKETEPPADGGIV